MLVPSTIQRRAFFGAVGWPAELLTGCCGDGAALTGSFCPVDPAPPTIDRAAIVAASRVIVQTGRATPLNPFVQHLRLPQRPWTKAYFEAPFGLTLSEAAQILGFDHFNWLSFVTRSPALDPANADQQVEVLGRTFRLGDIIPRRINGDPMAPVPFVDPPRGGYSTFNPAMGTYVELPHDDLPWYFDEEPLQSDLRLDAWMKDEDSNGTAERLYFVDSPSSSHEIEFLTALVGVFADGTSAELVPGTIFRWRYVPTPTGGVTEFALHRGADATGSTELSRFTGESELTTSELAALRALGIDVIDVDDLTAPTTSAVGSPAPNTNGWNSTDVAVNLTAMDDQDGSGVREIVTTLSGSQSGTFVKAGSDARVVVSAEGGTTVTYFATDNAGNQEPAKTLLIHIDGTPPVVTLATPVSSYRVDETITVTCSASDALSGIGSYTCSAATVTSVPAYTFGIGAQTRSASATDLAGNTRQASISFSVVVTPSTLCVLTKQFVQSSSKYQALTPKQRATIDKLADVLCSTLSAIVPKLTPNQKARLIANYTQAVTELSAKGWLTAEQATILRDLTRGL